MSTGSRIRSICRRVVASAILLASLAPFSYALAPLFAAADDTCTMACRGTKSCCCRNAHKRSSAAAGSQWRPVTGCLEGCRRPVGVAPIAPCAAIPMAVDARPETGASLVPLASEPVRIAHGTKFIVFERPPPSFS